MGTLSVAQVAQARFPAEQLRHPISTAIPPSCSYSLLSPLSFEQFHLRAVVIIILPSSLSNRTYSYSCRRLLEIASLWPVFIVTFPTSYRHHLRTPPPLCPLRRPPVIHIAVRAPLGDPFERPESSRSQPHSQRCQRTTVEGADISYILLPVRTSDPARSLVLLAHSASCSDWIFQTSSTLDSLVHMYS